MSYLKSSSIASCFLSVSLTASVAYGAVTYMEVEDEAKLAQVNALAAQLGAASAKNYTYRVGTLCETSLVIPAEVADCRHVSASLPERALPPGYSISPKAIAENDTVLCELKFQNFTATFTGHGI